MLVFIIGPTNAGKGTFLGLASADPKVGLVEVGKELRRRYPPGYFKGEGAPAHTANEAWQVMLDQIAAARNAGKSVILIDGQPRDVTQAHGTVDLPGAKRYIHLYASHELRLRRAIQRDGADLPQAVKDEVLAGRPPDNIPPALDLSIKRMVTDYKSVYNVLGVLGIRGQRVHTVSTETELTQEGVLEELRVAIRSDA